VETSIKDFAQNIPTLNNWSHPEKIKLFAWYIHKERRRDRFNLADIRLCYDGLHLEKPGNLSLCLLRLEGKTPKEVIRDSKGYFLEKKIQDQFERKFSQRLTTVQVHKLLQELPSQIPDLAERTFLNEAILCFQCGAFRAAIVMSWNLAYDHLCNYVLRLHLAAFNTQLPLTFPRAGHAPISKRDDFANIKESEVLQVCKSAGIITADLHKIMKEKLDRRNMAAHPSLIKITQLQAEDYISDLVNNMVIRLV
jgi:hypothetical protein